jgi:anti-anti-sigma factor
MKTKSTAAIRIVDVDFDAKSARIERSPDGIGDGDRLERVLRACRDCGLTPIIGVGGASCVVRQKETPTWRCCDVPGEGNGVEYHIRMECVPGVVERMRTAIILIGESCEMDDMTRKRLRFCVYELASNTIEHGIAGGARPEIRLTLRLEKAAIRVIYRDNGHPFATDNPGAIDVMTKVARGDRRGLGLFLLQRLSRVEYRRTRNWNTTVLTLELRRPVETYEERRTSVEDLTIEIIPCRIEGTAVLKPVGSIDSSTTQILEKQIQSVVSQGSRRIVVDFSSVEFISSAGIGVLLGVAAQLRGLGGDLLFMNLTRHVDELFGIINLNSFFTIISNLDELQATTRR